QSIKAARQRSPNNLGPGGQSADAYIFRFRNHTLEFAQTRNVHHSSSNWTISKPRKKFVPARQDLSPGTGQDVNRLIERVGPEIQEMTSKSKSQLRLGVILIQEA